MKPLIVHASAHAERVARSPVRWTANDTAVHLFFADGKGTELKEIAQ